MRVKTFAITPAIVPSVSFACNKPVCIFAGHAFYLHATRELLDGDDDGTPIDESKDRIKRREDALVFVGVIRINLYLKQRQSYDIIEKETW